MSEVNYHTINGRSFIARSDRSLEGTYALDKEARLFTPTLLPLFPAVADLYATSYARLYLQEGSDDLRDGQQIRQAYILPWPLGNRRFRTLKHSDFKTSSRTTGKIDRNILGKRLETVYDIFNQDISYLLANFNTAIIDPLTIDYCLITPPAPTRKAPPVWARLKLPGLGFGIPELGAPEEAVGFQVITQE